MLSKAILPHLFSIWNSSLYRKYCNISLGFSSLFCTRRFFLTLKNFFFFCLWAICQYTWIGNILLKLTSYNLYNSSAIYATVHIVPGKMRPLVSLFYHAKKNATSYYKREKYRSSSTIDAKLQCLILRIVFNFPNFSVSLGVHRKFYSIL